MGKTKKRRQRPPKHNPMKPSKGQPNAGDKMKRFKPGMKMGRVIG